MIEFDRSRKIDIFGVAFPFVSKGVGKTSLLIRFDEDKFSPNFITTIGYVILLGSTQWSR